MAIQVNGTQVIGNSRELTNIASVDATTVAAFGSAGVGGYKNNVLAFTLTSTQTYTIPFDCDLFVIATGGGGGGGYSQTGNAAGGSGRASGGAAAGMAIKLLAGFSTGNTLSITIGAGGIGGTNNFGTGSGAVSGSNGGTTTVASSGRTTLTANGGGGGTAGTGTTNRSSGSGGTASGGGLNLTGGTSSTSYVSQHTPGDRRAAAGGGISLDGPENASLAQTTGTGNFSATVGSGTAISPANIFDTTYDLISIPPSLTDPRALGQYRRYDGYPLFFGLSTAGGRGATNHEHYGYHPHGLPGHFGGGGGGSVWGNNNAGNYSYQSGYPRGGPGGTGFVHLVLLKGLGDL